MSPPVIRRILLAACFIICVRLEHVDCIPRNFGNLGHDQYGVKYLEDEDFSFGSTNQGRPPFPGRRPQAINRLPNTTEPIHYDIEISTLIHAGKRDFYGNVSIQVQIIQNTNQIVLNSLGLTIAKATILRQNENKVYQMTYDFQTETQTLKLKPISGNIEFKTDEILIIRIEYNATLREDMNGFYVSTYKDNDKNDRYLATTQFESTSARFAFPCFDEPSRRATFAITIKHDPSYFALSNMPEDTNRSSAGITVFQRTLKMPTYLVAFIVSDFKSTGSEIDSIPHRIFSRPGTEYYQRFALNTSMEVLKSLSEYFGVRYDMPKMDHVALPDFASEAMENWGLCTYQERFLLFNNHSSTLHEQFKIANTIAHELVHQWFGNHITIKWWDTLWLKEGFATLYAYEIIQKIYPEWNYAHQFYIEVQRFINRDSLQSSRPMTYRVESPVEIRKQYDFVSYIKAATMISMWQNALGDEVFRQGLHNFLERNKLGAATESDFFNAMEMAVQANGISNPENITTMMSTWTKYAGHPILFVKRNYDDGSLIIYQKRFYFNATLNARHHWHIPINFATKSNPDYNSTTALFVMASSEQAIEPNVPNDDWILFNKQGTALYRVNYDDRNWNLLTQALKENPSQFHNINRGQMLDDAYRFAITKRLNHAIVMELMTYLPKETHNFPWSMAKIILLDMNRFLKHHEKYKSFKEFVTNLVSGIYEKVGVNEDPSESVHQKLLRVNILQLACTIGMQQCLNDTKRKLIDYTRNAVEIEPNLRNIVYCHGLAEASNYEFNYIFNELMVADSWEDRRELVEALACAQRKKHLRKLIKSSINMTNNFEEDERTKILGLVYEKGPVGWFVCIEFLKKHWKEYNSLTERKYYETAPLETDIDGMSDNIFNKYQEQKLMELFNMTTDLNCVKFQIEKTIKSAVKGNQEWLKDNGDIFMNWFLEAPHETTISRVPEHNAQFSFFFVFIVALIVKYYFGWLTR